MSQESMKPADPPEKSRWRGSAQLALIVLVIAVALYFAQAPDRVDREQISGTAQATPVVTVVSPAATEHTVTATLTGTVAAERRARVRSEVEGRVVWISPNFTEGGMVRTNEPFIKIDPRQFELEVQRAKMEVGEAEAELQIARGLAEEEASRQHVIARAEARLGKASAALALAELRLAQTEISLPFDGHVMSTDVEVGEMVGPAATVGRAAKLGIVYRRGGLQLRVPVDPEELSKLEPVVGRSARVHTRSGTYEAEVVGKSSVVARKTRLTAVFLKFSDGASLDLLPLPGTFAQVEIIGPKRGDVYVLPASTAREHDAVWVVKDDALSAATPKTISRTDAGWVVEAFDAGDGVVVGVLSGARQGLKVKTASGSSSE